MASVASAAACALTFGSACVDPKEDYDDWLARTADARAATTVVEAGVFEGAPPDSGFDQTYLMVCLPQLANDQPQYGLMFQVVLNFTASAGGSGTLDYTQTPLAAGTTDFSATVGPPTTVDGSIVMPDGHCDVQFGPTTIPGAANGLTHNDVVFASSTLHFLIASEAQVCANLSGHVTAPLDVQLVPSQNICIFRTPTSPLPALTKDQFHCP